MNENIKKIDNETLTLFQSMNKRSQLGKYTDEAKVMWSTQMLEQPINVMDSIINQDFADLMEIYEVPELYQNKTQSLSEILKNKAHPSKRKTVKKVHQKKHRTKYVTGESFDQMLHPKYMMYSSHDTQLGIIWEFLKPTNFDPDSIPYASFLHMELYKDPTCYSEI